MSKTAVANPGVDILLGGLMYTMPPCGFDTLEKYSVELDEHVFGPEASTGLTMHKIKLTINVVWGALQRNYPDITREVVASGLTADNAGEYLTKALSQSLPKSPAALQGDGEGAKTLGESTGAASAPA